MLDQNILFSFLSFEIRQLKLLQSHGNLRNQPPPPHPPGQLSFPFYLSHIFEAHFFKFNRRDPLEERADPRFGTPSLLTLVIQGEHGVLGMVGRTATIDPQGWVLS